LNKSADTLIFQHFHAICVEKGNAAFFGLFGPSAVLGGRRQKSKEDCRFAAALFQGLFLLLDCG